jgi:hypothetical protein
MRKHVVLVGAALLLTAAAAPEASAATYTFSEILGLPPKLKVTSTMWARWLVLHPGERSAF